MSVGPEDRFPDRKHRYHSGLAGITGLTTPPVNANDPRMRYDQFRAAWASAQRSARLRPMGLEPRETLDQRSLSRTYAVGFEGPRAEPFHVGAQVSWDWDALLTARSATNEEDMLTELFGRSTTGRGRKMTPPSVRVDVAFRASLEWGKSVVLPSQDAWEGWCLQTVDELHGLWTAPLNKKRKARAEPLVTCWAGEPTAQVEVQADGRLLLSSLELLAWRFVEFPPTRDGHDAEGLPEPERALTTLLERVGKGLDVWTAALAQLAPRRRGPVH